MVCGRKIPPFSFSLFDEQERIFSNPREREHGKPTRTFCGGWYVNARKEHTEASTASSVRKSLPWGVLPWFSCRNFAVIRLGSNGSVRFRFPTSKILPQMRISIGNYCRIPRSLLYVLKKQWQTERADIGLTARGHFRIRCCIPSLRGGSVNSLLFSAECRRKGVLFFLWGRRR